MPRLDKFTLVFLWLAVLLSIQFTTWHLRYNDPNEVATPAMLAAGTAATPFQYRALVPWLAGALHRAFPAADLDEIYFKLDLVATVALVIAFRRFLSLFFPDPRHTALLALGLFYVLPFNFIGTSWYPADIPSLAFMTLGLYLLYRRQWAAFYPLFIVATFNRETTFLLTAVYVLAAFRREPLRAIALHIGAQAALWLAVKASLAALYAGNPGAGLAEIQILKNAAFLLYPPFLFAVLSNWGGLWLPVLLWRRHVTDPFLRRALLVVPGYLLALLAVGWVHELRIYGELIPIVLTAFLLIGRALLTVHLAHRDAPLSA